MPSACAVIALVSESVALNGHIRDLSYKLLRHTLFDGVLPTDPLIALHFAYAVPYRMHRMGADDGVGALQFNRPIFYRW